MRLPADDRLFAAKRLLLIGAGGGYDVLGAVPLFLELRQRGIVADLANVSFTDLATLAGAEPDAQHGFVYRVHGASATASRYCPEAWLARWLEEVHGYHEPVWSLSKVGVRPLRAGLVTLTERLGTDL